MRILFDQGTPAPLRYELPGHHVTTAHEMGWAQLNNGELLLQAESRFDLLITTDQDLRHQQNLSGRRLAILVLPTTAWPLISQRANEVAVAVHSMKPGAFRQLQFAD